MPGPARNIPILAVKIGNGKLSSGNEEFIKYLCCFRRIFDMMQGHGTHDPIKPREIGGILSNTPFTGFDGRDAFFFQFPGSIASIFLAESTAIIFLTCGYRLSAILPVP